MKLPVYLYGHPVLRKVSEPLEPSFAGLNELVAEMFDAMYESEGVGLAAPQIGRNIRLVVIDADPVSESFPELCGPQVHTYQPRDRNPRRRPHIAPRRLPQPARHIRERTPRGAHQTQMARRRLRGARRRNIGLPRPHCAARM